MVMEMIIMIIMIMMKISNLLLLLLTDENALTQEPYLKS